MFAGLMLGLKSQQRRLLTGGPKHISFSRDAAAAAGGLIKPPSAAAASAERGAAGGGRRRRRLTDDATTGQQQQKQPQHAGRSRDPTNSSSRRRSRAADALQQQQQQVPAADLGLKRASELEAQERRRSSPDGSSSSASTRSLHPAAADSSEDSSSSHEASSTPSTPSAWSSSSEDGTCDTEPLLAADRATPAASSSRSRFVSEEDEAVAAAINRISRFLDFRERCASEVLSKLAEVGCEPQLARAVLRRMQEAGMQDDARFAEMFARGQWLRRAQAPSRIAYELRVRRVAQQHIDSALAAVFGDSRQLAAGSRESSDNHQDASWEQLVRVCRQRVEATSMQPAQKRRAKLATWLQRRGHSLATAFKMFEELDI